MTSRRRRSRTSLLFATVVALSLVAAACGDDPDAAPEPVETTAPPTTPPTSPPADDLSAERLAAIEAWTTRPFDEILADGFDAASCAGAAGPDIGRPPTVRGLGWAFLPLPLDVMSLESPAGETRPAVVLVGDEIHPNPIDGYVPTHAWISRADAAMLTTLTDATATTAAEVVLGIGPTDEGRAGRAAERMADASFAWILTDDAVIPFSGECGAIAVFTDEVGDPLAELAHLRTDAHRRAELAGLTDDALDFSDCQNREIGISTRPGFGGAAVGLAFGPWPADAATFTDIELDGWTVLPPAGEDAPAFAVRIDGGFPEGKGLDPDGWLFTFAVDADRAVVQTLYHADDVLGLRVWTTVPTVEDGACFDARQVIAFREFIDGTVPDRNAWDLTPALPGDEATVVETLRMLITDEMVRAAFHEWTPCTSKLCELNDEVVR